MDGAPEILRPGARPFLGDRQAGGTMSWFKFTHKSKTTTQDDAALRVDHPALTEARTLFPTRVFDPAQSDHVLIPGSSNAKVGGHVTKGPWQGRTLYTLSLEERATCPTSCGLWRECYGNTMPLAKRWAYGPALIERLGADLRAKARQHKRGFAVRLHVLGDFPDLIYVDAWGAWLAQMPRLAAWGYTAHPADSDMGRAIARVALSFPGRFMIRHSVAADVAIEPMQATTVWRQDRGEVAEGVVCPAQTEGTDACGTCGLCWSPSATDKRIVFLGHGMNRARGPRTITAPAAPVAINGAPPMTATLAIEIKMPAEFTALMDRLITISESNALMMSHIIKQQADLARLGVTISGPEKAPISTAGLRAAIAAREAPKEIGPKPISAAGLRADLPPKEITSLDEIFDRGAALVQEAYQRGGEAKAEGHAAGDHESARQTVGEDDAQAHRSPAPTETISPASQAPIAPAQAEPSGDPGQQGGSAALPAMDDVSSQTAPAAVSRSPAASSAMNEAMARASQVNAAPPPGRQPSRYTPERIQLIEDKYRIGWSVDNIVREANKMPGEPLKVSTTATWISVRGLKRNKLVTIPATAKQVPKGDPVRASKEAIWQWGSLRGVAGKFDIDRINAKAEAIGHPGFIVA